MEENGFYCPEIIEERILEPFLQALNGQKVQKL